MIKENDNGNYCPKMLLWPKGRRCTPCSLLPSPWGRGESLLARCEGSIRVERLLGHYGGSKQSDEVATHLLSPPETGGVPRSGEGVD